ncbi:hypothetical protein [Nibribacter koreensis]
MATRAAVSVIGDNTNNGEQGSECAPEKTTLLSKSQDRAHKL